LQPNESLVALDSTPAAVIAVVERDGERLLEHLLRIVDHARKRLREVRGLVLLDDVVDPAVTIDRAKLAINVSGTGASGLALEDDLVAAGLGHADVVKVPHHGSPTSSTAGFVAATHPGLAVISCGRGNAFGFPSPEVVGRWRAAGADVARTDIDGAITVTIDGDGELAIDRLAP